MDKKLERRIQYKRPGTANNISVMSGNILHKPLFSIAAVILIGFSVYANTFSVPFLFDDQSSIQKTGMIKVSDYFTKALFSEIIISPRPIAQFTFALNHMIHGLNVTGYHIINLLIHLICALLLYWFVVLIFQTPCYADYLEAHVNQSFHVEGFVALFAALLFVSHPIQTQAVTYIVQRYTSLCTLFYLLSLVMYITARLFESSQVRYVFFTLSILSAVLAMKTKEFAFTLPVIIMLFEFMFFQGDVTKRVLYLIPILLTMIIIPLSLMKAQSSFLHDTVSVDELTKVAGAPDISRWDYLNTQFRVIMTYIRLLFLPVNQNLDYDYPVYRTFFTLPVLSSFLSLLTILGGGVALLYRSIKDKTVTSCWYRLIAFGIFWFFITLSVESSIIPIKDVIFEHRLYLPSVGFSLAVMATLMLIRNRLGYKSSVEMILLAVMIVIVAGLSTTTYARNMVWQDEVAFWKDVVSKSSNKARPHNNLGGSYLKYNRIEEAVKELSYALQIAPNYSSAHNNLGLGLEKLGKTKDAITHYSEAIRINPTYADAHSNLGVALIKEGKKGNAIKHFKLALQINPHHEEANNNMGLLEEEAGRIDEAINYFNNALTINPSFADGHNNLGSALIRSGRIDAAMEHIAFALKIKPNFAEAEFNMGNALLIKGLLNDAVSHYTNALRIIPDYAEAHNNMGSALLRQGKSEEAIAHYRKALLIKSTFEDANRNLQIALRNLSQTKNGSDQRK